MSTNNRVVADFWLFLEPWYARWYECEIFIASCTDSIYDLENERWSFGDMIDHVGIYGSRVAEGLSAFNVGLVFLFGHIGQIVALWWPKIAEIGAWFLTIIWNMYILVKWIVRNDLIFGHVIIQGSFCECALSVRNSVSLLTSSLIGLAHPQMIPDCRIVIALMNL